MRRAISVCLFGLLAGTATAAEYRVGPDSYRDILPGLTAGDRVLLAPGDYLRGLPLRNLSGEPERPIVIEAEDPARPPRLLARPGANTVSLVDVRYLVLRHLRLDGRNLPVDAIKAEGHGRYADHVTLEHLHIHDHAASQQNVGISTKCPAFGWRVANNRIERVGTGMYFGDSDGSDAFVAGLIEGNHVSATLGYSLQIKHQRARPPGITGRHETVIRHNVFDKRDAKPGPLARPNVLLGHWPLTGEGSEDRYRVYGNLFLHNPGEALFQAEGRVAVYDNVFVNGRGDALRIQPHNDVPREVEVYSNTVLASGAGIQVRQGEGQAFPLRVWANVVAAGVTVRGGEQAFNVELPYRDAWRIVPPARLTAALLDGRAVPRLPLEWSRELAPPADWRPAPLPGAWPATIGPAWAGVQP